MDSSLSTNLLSAWLTLLAYMVVPILFTVIYPNKLRALFCCIFGLVHGGLVFLFFYFIGLGSLVTTLLAIAEALVWTGSGVLIMCKIGACKEERTVVFTSCELPWFKKDMAVRIMLTVLLAVEFAVYFTELLLNVK